VERKPGHSPESERKMEHGYVAEPCWRKSSYSGTNGGGCVEVGNGDRSVMVRDTVLGESSPVLAFTRQAWRDLLMSVKAEEL
jgi:hypothetical protein